jgi:hypothetical protein
MANPIKVGKSVVKTISAGKKKVEKRVAKLDEEVDYRTGGSFGFGYKKGKLTQYEYGDKAFPITKEKVKPRNLGKVTKKIVPSGKTANKIIKKYKQSPPAVPVKKRGK